jgi:hypothetical protein
MARLRALSPPPHVARCISQFAIVTTIALALLGCSGGGGNPPPPPKTDIFPLPLDAQPYSGTGPRPFKASFPPAIGTLTGNITALSNPNNLRIGVVTIASGHNTDQCFNDPAAAVVLASGATTTSQNLMEIFGSQTPAFSTSTPVNIAVCVEGGPDPGGLSLTVTYTH